MINFSTMGSYARIVSYLLILFFISCNRQNKTEERLNKEKEPSKNPVSIPVSGGNTRAVMGRNILSIFQDINDNYWFGTNGEGVFRYDGKTLVQYTVQDGLCNNEVKSIQGDTAGNVWFGTGGGVCRFDGQKFTTLATKESSEVSKTGKTGSDDLWFFAGNGAYRYDGKGLTYLVLPGADEKYSVSPKPIKPYLDPLSPYSVYCTFKDKKGNVWFGTQTMGVCLYDGKSFRWFKDNGLAGPAVRGLFEDSKGNLWFGNNGYGLIRYDPVSDKLTNFTKEKGLSNDDFLSNSTLAGKPMPGTMARVWTINEDKEGMLWIGTIDAGVWRYDGKNLKNYTLRDGLSSNAISVIYKDNKGELWFGTDDAGVCKFNGMGFEKVVFN